MCEEKCMNDARCEECSGSESKEESGKIKQISLSFYFGKKTFKIAEFDEKAASHDICDECMECGVGQYFFDEKLGYCRFSNTCAVITEENKFFKEF